MTKKVLIFFSLIFIIIGLLLFLGVRGFNLIWATVFVLPILFIADLCYVILPITIPVLFGLTTYSIVKKDFVKFNPAFEILLICITCGITNYIIDRLLNNASYINITPCLKIYFLIFLACTLVLGIINLRKYNDNRLYIWIYVPFVFFYMIYEVIRAAE